MAPSNNESPFVDSPCKDICQIDDAGGLCIGCGRTLAEIAGWRDMTDAERRTIMTGLAQRLSVLQPGVAVQGSVVTGTRGA